jgi:hypothetical protein
MSSTVNKSPCAQCGEQVSVTGTNLASGDQLAIDQMECPNCGAHLVRDIDGHADHGWRLVVKPDG